MQITKQSITNKKRNHQLLDNKLILWIELRMFCFMIFIMIKRNTIFSTEAYPHLLFVHWGKLFMPLILAPPWGLGFGVGTESSWKMGGRKKWRKKGGKKWKVEQESKLCITIFLSCPYRTIARKVVHTAIIVAKNECRKGNTVMKWKLSFF